MRHFWELCLWCAVVHVGRSEDGQPSFAESFKAGGEISQTDMSTGPTVNQLMYEENYDSRSEIAAYTHTVFGKSATFWQNKRTSKIYRYEGKNCEPYDVEQWLKQHIAPDFGILEKDHLHIYFPVKQLLSIANFTTEEGEKFTVKGVSQTTYRDVPAQMWTYSLTYKTREIQVDSYWSVPKWNTTSAKEVDPLGFKITHKEGESVSRVQFVNVMYFVRRTYDWNAVQQPTDIYCPREKSDQEFPSVKDFTAFSFHSDFVLPDSDVFMNVDTYFDTENKLLRVDMEHSKSSSTGSRPTPVTEITSQNQGVVYSLIREGAGVSCEVTPIQDFSYDFHYIFNPKNDTAWTPNSFYGLDSTASAGYFYLEKVRKRGLPCGLWQGLRSDWPPSEKDMYTVWEWCFMNPFGPEDVEIEGEDGSLVNLEITITQPPPNSSYPVGYKFIHHVYDFKKQTSAVLDSMSFDISECYGNTGDQKGLVFKLKVDPSQKVAFKSSTNIDLMAQSKLQVTKAAGLSPTSMRVSQLRIRNVNDTSLYVDFTFLDVHPKLPQDVKSKETSLKDAINNLNATINKGDLKITWTPTGTKQQEPIILNAEANSLREIFMMLIQERTTTTTESITTMESSPIPLTRPGYTPGNMATAGIVAFLLGIGLGLLGTFLKYKYFAHLCPKC